MRKVLIPIFILIVERESKLMKNIKKLLSLPIKNNAQWRLLESLVKSLNKITQQLENRIMNLQYAYPSIGMLCAPDNQVTTLSNQSVSYTHLTLPTICSV
eukprot:TRINITY_DN14917_c0_g2_i1.p1 TRINITY_DN14917_c0_g2~~TRINITY_DN14917_c0_g2_i1.p1  ORF type:complete len:100 (-),score=12.62 TRINITY_DN14917_c0_g2_i1:51-350(-)